MENHCARRRFRTGEARSVPHFPVCILHLALCISASEIARERFQNLVYLGDNLPILQRLAAGSVHLIYVDPPFNTGGRQSRLQLKTVRSEDGDRVGFGGRRYRTIRLGSRAFADRFEDYIAFLRPRMVEARRVLAPAGSIYVHLNYREVHYAKVMLDEIFGRECFLNEIIWAYDYGARTRTALAGQARQHPLVREGPGALHVQRRRRGPHPVHGAGPGRRGEGARGASCRPTPGGTRSSARRARRRPATRRRSRWASCGG